MPRAGQTDHRTQFQLRGVALLEGGPLVQLTLGLGVRESDELAGYLAKLGWQYRLVVDNQLMEDSLRKRTQYHWCIRRDQMPYLPPVRSREEQVWTDIIRGLQGLDPAGPVEEEVYGRKQRSPATIAD